MYCYKCGLKISEAATECEHCEANVAHVMIPRFYKLSVTLGICMLAPALMALSIFFTALLGTLDSIAVYFFIIFGIAGLPLALKSKRRLAIALNVTGIIIWLLIVITPFFTVDDIHNEHYQDRQAASEALEAFIK
jgi:hypothetical protein